jgi:transcriptional regulator with XRE-family HTH domain
MIIDADYLRRLRRERRLSLSDVAALIGKDRSTVWRYENNKINIPSSELLKLAELYGVSLEQLMAEPK